MNTNKLVQPKRIISICLLLFISLFTSACRLKAETEFTILTISLLLFVLFIIGDIYKTQGSVGIGALCVLFFIFQFLIQVCIGNINLYTNQHYYNPGWDYLVKTMRVMMISAIGYSLGMEAKLFNDTGKKWHRIVFQDSFPYPSRASYKRCVLLFAIMIPIYIWAINKGIVGYNSSSSIKNYESNLAISTITTYIVSISEMIAYILFADVLIHPESKGKIPCSIIIALRLGLAMISGMKADIILMMASLAIVYYVCKGKIPKKTIIIGILLTLIVYSFNDAYRNVLRDQSGSSLSRFEAFTTAIQASTTDYDNNDGSVTNKVLSRIGTTESAGAVILYSDSHGLTENDPNFLKDFVLIPINTFVPRIIFPNKAVFQYGLWVTQTVYGQNLYSSSYLTIQGCFYLMGGYFAVFFGSLFLAAFLRLVSGFVDLRKKNVAALCVYLMILKSLYEPNDPTTLTMGMLRNIIIYPLLCLLLIKKESINANEV